jgi:hypothetical protein
MRIGTAVVPSPAAVMTWACGLTAFTAVHPPGWLVRPDTSATTSRFHGALGDADGPGYELLASVCCGAPRCTAERRTPSGTRSGDENVAGRQRGAVGEQDVEPVRQPPDARGSGR